MVQTAVKAAWGSALTAVKPIQTSLEEMARRMLDPLLEGEESLKEKVVEAVGGVVRPLFTMVGEKCIKPYLRFAVKHISDSHAGFFTAFVSYFDEKVEAIGTDPAKQIEITDYSMRECEYYYFPPIYSGARPHIDTIYKSEALDNLYEISGYRVSNSIIASRLYETLRQLALNAVYTFKKETSGLFDLSRRKSALRDVIIKLANDTKQNMNDMLTQIIADTMQSTVDQSIMQPALSAVQPIASLVPEPLQELINITVLTEDCVQRIIDNELIGAAVEPVFEPEGQRIDASLGTVLETTLAM